MRCCRPRLIVAALALALAAPPAAAAPPGGRKGAAENSQEDAIDKAIAAWARGDWSRVRSILEPLVGEDKPLSSPILREKGLRYLADATLQDDSLDLELRTRYATTYIERLLEEDDAWRPPEATHGPELYRLVNDLRERREQAKYDLCLAERAACAADFASLEERYAKEKAAHEATKKLFEDQEVEVQAVVARNRAVALVPFGVGHFYNGNKALGGTFLAAELAIGAVGLGLLIPRVVYCKPPESDDSSSDLDCPTDVQSQSAWVRQRNAEQFFGFAFLGAIVIDIVVSQILFKPTRTVTTRRVPRKVLDAERQQGEDERGGKPPARSRNKPRATLRARPTPAFIRGGAGMGFTLRF